MRYGIPGVSQHYITLGAFPLPFNCANSMEMCQFRKTPIYRKNKLRLHEVFFQAIRKTNNSQKCNGNIFRFTGKTSPIIILQCTITPRNTSCMAADEYKGFPCH